MTKEHNFYGKAVIESYEDALSVKENAENQRKSFYDNYVYASIGTAFYLMSLVNLITSALSEDGLTMHDFFIVLPVFLISITCTCISYSKTNWFKDVFESAIDFIRWSYRICPIPPFNLILGAIGSLFSLSFIILTPLTIFLGKEEIAHKNLKRATKYIENHLAKVQE